jgi:hypothetical protein
VYAPPSSSAQREIEEWREAILTAIGEKVRGQDHTFQCYQPKTQTKRKHPKKKKKKKNRTAQSVFVGEKFSGAEIDPADIILAQERGGGCFGKVYEGRVHGKPVAIKVPLIQDLDSAQLESLRNEIRIMRSVIFQNLRQVFLHILVK